MWSQTRSILYAGVFSCAVHILLLGMAAAILVTLPSQPRSHLHVTLFQRAVPLPVQEPATAGREASKPPTLQVLPREAPPPKPVTLKKHMPPVPRRLPKPVVQPKRVTLPEPPPVVKEEPSLSAAVVPPFQADLAPTNEPIISEAGSPILSSGVDTSSEPLASMNTPATANGNGRGDRGEGRGEGQANSPSAAPDYNVNPKPPYPLIARRIGAQGEVLLRVLVRQDGSVGSVELARSSGFSLLDDSATRTVRDMWKFIPAQFDGAPVESWVEVPIKFVLADS